MGALGAGSDYVAFIDHLGVASLNFGFGGPNLGGVYHSIYDDPAWFEQFGDPGFVYGAALSQVTATTLLRLADAPLLPFEFGEFAHTVQRYVDEIKKQAGTKVDFRPVLRPSWRRPKRMRRLMRRPSSGGQHRRPTPARLAKANQALYETERGAHAPKGLPGRDWYRHQIYAPGPVYRLRGEDPCREFAKRWKGRAGTKPTARPKDVAQALKQINQHIEGSDAAVRF